VKGLLRICTAGSVDDGKSTLIGRLLHDSQAVYEDQISAVQKASKNRVAGPIDFSLFTDGLKAEREQGITIDVAYRYFATARRKFILADTPGHEQYTRNMATGASTAELAILLVDARQGVKDQSRRHARIARLLGITNFVVAVNKMDLVGFDKAIYDGISAEFAEILKGTSFHAIPLSALEGDNVITLSERTPWFTGPSLIEHLETVDVDTNLTAKPFRFPVQLVLRPHQDFRGYAGQIQSGMIRRGDDVTVWPSGRSTAVKRIVTYEGDIESAFAPMSVTLVLEDEIDISRGDTLVSGPVQVGQRFQADIVWMDERSLEPSRMYVLKHSTRVVTAEIDRAFQLNEIATAAVRTSRPIIFDSYQDVRATGSFILIDPATNFTAGAGMISMMAREDTAGRANEGAAERLARLARAARTDAEAIDAVRAALEDIIGR